MCLHLINLLNVQVHSSKFDFFWSYFVFHKQVSLTKWQLAPGICLMYKRAYFLQDSKYLYLPHSQSMLSNVLEIKRIWISHEIHTWTSGNIQRSRAYSLTNVAANARHLVADVSPKDLLTSSCRFFMWPWITVTYSSIKFSDSFSVGPSQVAEFPQLFPIPFTSKCYLFPTRICSSL